MHSGISEWNLEAEDPVVQEMIAYFCEREESCYHKRIQKSVQDNTPLIVSILGEGNGLHVGNDFISDEQIDELSKGLEDVLPATVSVAADLFKGNSPATREIENNLSYQAELFVERYRKQYLTRIYKMQHVLRNDAFAIELIKLWQAPFRSKVLTLEDAVNPTKPNVDLLTFCTRLPAVYSAVKCLPVH